MARAADHEQTRIDRIVKAIGYGFAIAIVLFVLYIFLETWDLSRDNTRIVQTNANMSGLVKAVSNYASANDDHLPPSDNWVECLLANDYLDAYALSSPAAKDGERCFAMNRHLSGIRFASIVDPERTVLFFSCAPGGPLVGDASDLHPIPKGLQLSFRHSRQDFIVCFADGRSELWSQGEEITLIWEPELIDDDAPPEP